MNPKNPTSKEFDQQWRSSGKGPSIVESLAMPEATGLEFEPPRLVDELLRLPELS